jgi:hypothetical protein
MAQYREQRTVTGDFMRVNIFPTHTYNYGRKKKVKPTGAAQEKLNKVRRERLLCDLVNLNFTKKDIQVKLDYSEFRKRNGRNPDPDEVTKLIRNFMRRLKRLYATLDIELKYIYCSEVGARGHLSHHHLIINAGATLEQLRALWAEGGVWCRKLYFDRKGAYDLASYFVKSRYTYRSYSCSKNLIRPQECGKNKCVFKDDHKIRQKQINYFINGEVDKLLALYPGWQIAEMPEISHTVDKNTGEVKLPTWGTFITLYLYKPEGLSDKEGIWSRYQEITEWRG